MTTPPPAPSRLSVPAAIVIAGACVGLGLYFGLRTPTHDVASTPDGAPPPAAQVPGSTPSSAPEATVPPVPPATPAQPTEDETAKSIRALVEQAWPRWKAACWDSVDPAARKPGQYIASLSFDATGKLVIFGINEIREASDPTIAQCLRRQHEPMTIPAPGKPISYEVPFQVP